MQDAFGVEREDIAKSITSGGQRALIYSAAPWVAPQGANSGGMRLVSAGRSARAISARARGGAPRPASTLKPSASSVAAGDEAVSGARSAMRGRANARRRLKQVGGTAGLAAAGGGAVVGIDAFRDKKKAS